MINLSFTGTTPLTTLFWTAPIVGNNTKSGTIIDIPSQGPFGNPPFDPFQGGGARASYSPDDQIIVWDHPSSGQVPAFLQGITFRQLAPLLGGNITISRSIILTATNGNQYTDSDAEPQLYIGLLERSSVLFSGNLLNAQYKATGTGPGTYNYVYNGNSIPLTLPLSDNPNISIDTVQAFPWSQCGTFPSCRNYSAYSVSMTAQMQITFTVNCTSNPGAINTSDLTSGFCLKFCSDNTNNLQVCFPEYNQYCFTNAAGATGPIIFENGGDNGCNTFFQAYLGSQGPGPSSALDASLNNACSFIKDLETFDAQTSGPNGIQNICACHINQEFYNNILNSIKALPGGGLVDVPAPCLFPPCINTVYKPNLTGKVCPTIKCINIADITNNGDIKGGTTINQQCIDNSSGGGGGGNGGGGSNTTPTSWWSKNYPWVFAGIGFFLVLIVVILIIIISDNSKKKR